MKKILSTIIASGIVLTSTHSFAASTTGTADATVIPDLSITQQTALNFGSFAPGSTGGHVTVGSGGTSMDGSVQKITDGTRGVFKVQGGASTTYTIAVPSSVTLSSGSNNMTAALSAPTSGSIDNTGNGYFNVDGVLTVAANQAAGAYTGQYTVTVNY
jgi:Mat/Ecp fimbriae major subunit